MALQDLESAIFDGHLSHLHVDWPTLGSNPQKKLLGRFLVLVGAASKVQVPVTSNGARRLHDMAVRGRSPRVPRWIAALKSSARLERRQWRADEVFGQWNHSDLDRMDLLKLIFLTISPRSIHHFGESIAMICHDS
jgi:hypothetical protein